MRKALLISFLLMMTFVLNAQDNKKNSISLSAGSVVSNKMESFSLVIDLATPNSYFSPMLSGYQYFVIRMIDKDLNVLDELYYDLGETSALWTTILKATEDGGCMIAGHFMDFVNEPFTCYNFIKKFPPEAFDNIEEPHAYGLKLAVAYPNPGGDIMNIRTSLRNATLQVYDMQRKKSS
ncbi:MAG: hypothetical protein IJZ87_08255 [Bacteroidales bacterium]|nr:hypothetical protein [Bacteroidales bacterium]